MRHLALAALLTAALLAGCATAPSADTSTSTRQGGNGFAPQQHHAAAHHPRDSNLTLAGDLRPCADGFCVNVTARNGGTHTYFVSNICIPAWSEGMMRDGVPVAHRAPRAFCMAFGTSAFGPGASDSFGASWNQTLWSDSGNHFEPAPRGAYVWSVTFRVYGGADGADSEAITVDFPVVVGET